MRRLLLVFCLTAIAMPALAQAPARKRIAVLDFDYATVRSSVGDIWGSDVDIGKASRTCSSPIWSATAPIP